MSKQQILFDSDAAAHLALNISGWVSSDGRFFGSDESAARFAGCTHRLCDCGAIIEKHYTMCASCRKKKEIEAYLLKPKKQWNGSDPLYSEAIDEYFTSKDLDSYMLDHKDEGQNFDISSLRLVICDPMYPKPIRLYDLYDDENLPLNMFDIDDNLPKDFTLSTEIEDAFKALNVLISSNTTPTHWIPGKYAYDPNLPQQILNPDQEIDPDIHSKPNNNSVFFFSNHKDLSFLKKCFPNKEIVLIPHPPLKPEWTEAEVHTNCSSTISKAVNADVLILNGDYFLVALILQARLALGKTTGFIACEKLNRPDSTTLNGVVSYSQSLKPIGLRWIKPQKDQISEWQRVHLILSSITKAGLSIGISSCQNGWEVRAYIDGKRLVLKVQTISLLSAMELLFSQLTITRYLK